MYAPWSQTETSLIISTMRFIFVVYKPAHCSSSRRTRCAHCTYATGRSRRRVNSHPPCLATKSSKTRYLGFALVYFVLSTSFRNASLSLSVLLIYSTAAAITVALLGLGCPMTPTSLLCSKVGTARRSFSISEFKPSRYLRSTWLCGTRLQHGLCCFSEEADGVSARLLRSRRGRPRLRSGRFDTNSFSHPTEDESG